MKIFKSIEKHFANVGLTASQSQKHPLNARNSTVLLTFVSNIILAGAYILYETNDFREYIESIFGCSTVAFSAIAFLNFIRQMPKIFKFLSNFDRTINKSKKIDLFLFSF